MAVSTLCRENCTHLRRGRRAFHDVVRRSCCLEETRISKRVNAGQRKGGNESQRTKDCCDPAPHHTISPSDESTMARWLCLATYRTSVIPKTLLNFPAGTTIGPACGAEPGAG